MEEQYEGLKEIHEINKLILRELERVCKKNNITYFLDSGALIGAARHKSFIPWDDDVDVAFTREEYNRFKELPASEWGEDFKFMDFKDIGDNIIYDYIPRLLYLGCKIDHKSSERMGAVSEINDRIGIDIFILDNAPSSEIMHKFLFLKLMMVYGMGLGHRGKLIYSDYSKVQAVIIFVLSKIGKLFRAETIFKWYELLSTSHNNKQEDYYFYSNYPINEMQLRYKKEWFNGTALVQIDNEKFMAPKNWKEVITTTYGDYMKLPPIENRVAAHYVLIK